MMDIDNLAKEIYQQNKAVGWWDDPDRCIFQTMQLVSTELAEATEGERKNLMDDHLPHRKMGEVELADALIRVLDMGGRYDWIHSDYMMVNSSLLTVDSIAGKHLILNWDLCLLACALLGESDFEIINCRYSSLINGLFHVAESQGYDIKSAMMEKLEYNKHRADHKRENRNKPGGKGF